MLSLSLASVVLDENTFQAIQQCDMYMCRHSIYNIYFPPFSRTFSVLAMIIHETPQKRDEAAELLMMWAIGILSSRRSGSEETTAD